jgi:hypothetical protein
MSLVPIVLAVVTPIAYRALLATSATPRAHYTVPRDNITIRRAPVVRLVMSLASLVLAVVTPTAYRALLATSAQPLAH